MIGALCLSHPDLRALLAEALSRPGANPLHYFSAALVIFASLTAYVWFLDKKLDVRQVGWIFYLLLLSIWEEWLFRLAIPYFAKAQAVDLGVAVITSNLLFGLMHYFTLRWKWTWCLAAFLGGLGLSQHMASNFDLAAIIGIHWIATSLNTPRLPGQPRKPDYDQHHL